MERPVLIVTHLADRGVGLARDCLRRAGCDVIERNPRDPEPLPGLDEISGIVSLGGRESARRPDAHPFIAAEVALLSQALAAQLPVLGMCLGAQLLAVAAGGEVVYSGHMYAGWPALVCEPAIADDPVFGTLSTGLSVLKWHEDVISTLPAGAVTLATSEGPGIALYRIGERAWGSQPHLELTPAMLVDGWLTDPDDAAEVIAAGHDLEAFKALSRDALRAQIAAATPMFEAFGKIARAA